MKNAGALVVLIAILAGLSYEKTIAQGETVLPSLNFLRSISSLGVGEQGVASLSAIDALQLNPANLVYSRPFQLSYFRSPLHDLLNMDIPLVAVASTISVPKIGYFGIEYLNWDESEFGAVTAYERSVAVGYARDLSPDFNVGVQLRYARGSFSSNVQNRALAATTDKLFMSAGVSYESRLLDRSVDFGFSLTNFGTAVTYLDPAQADPPPSQLNIGANLFALESDHYSLALQVEMTKPIVKRDATGAGQSSFTSLFNDWSDFPRDATLHTGLAYRWMPLELGNGFSLYQEFYVGNNSAGSVAGLRNYWAHGATVGVGYNRYHVALGYAGLWYNTNPDVLLAFPQNLPSEMFQVTFSADQSPFFENEVQGAPLAGLKHIFLAVGTGPSFRVGRYHEISDASAGFQRENTFSYFLESDFYIDKANALIAKLTYDPIPVHIVMNFLVPGSTIDSKIETFAFSSLYRYHPFDGVRPLYVQGGLGIIRSNPVFGTTPQYYYNTNLTVGAGALLEVGSDVVVIPTLDFTTLLDRVSNGTPGLGGYNQFDIGVKVGYAVK